MRTLIRSAILLSIAGLLALTTGCFTPQANCRYETPPQKTSIAFEDAKTFEAKLPAGSLSIEGWDKPTVEMTAKVWAKAVFPKSAERLAKDTKIDVVREGEKVFIRYEPAVSMIDTERVGADIIVHVPAQAAAEATAMYADISARDLAGAVQLNSIHGDITLANLRGPADCTATHGDIKITSAAGAVNLRTIYGDIRLTDIAGAVHAQTTHGDIALLDPGDAVDCNTTYGDVRITAKDGCWNGDLVKVRTVHGDIEVSLDVKAPKPGGQP